MRRRGSTVLRRPPSGRPFCCTRRDGIDRRDFLRISALAAASLTPGWAATGPSLAGTRRRDVLVSVFLRGGADGLSLCVPHGDSAYYALRPTLAIAPPDARREPRAIDLDGFFGLPPAMAPLEPAYRAGDLLIVHATGLPDASRSHFDASRAVESGWSDPPPSLHTGWLGRHLAATAPLDAASSLRAVGLGYGLPRTLLGAPHAEAIADPSGTLAGISSAAGADYPRDELGDSLQAAAGLIRSQSGLEAIAIDVGGWDTHDDQGPASGRLALRMNSLARGLAAFRKDLTATGHPRWLLVAMSEFGRSAIENGSRGTDHGTGGVLLALGGAIDGGRVLADWPGLERGRLFEGRDLAVTTDYRDVLWEILSARLGSPSASHVFPDPKFRPIRLGMLVASATARTPLGR